MFTVMLMRFKRLKDSALLFGIMTGLSIFLAFIFSSSGIGGNYKYIVLVIDEDHTTFTQTLYEKIVDGDTSFKFQIENKDTAREIIESGDALLGVAFNKGLTDAYTNNENMEIEFIIKKETNEVRRLQNVISGIISESKQTEIMVNNLLSNIPNQNKAKAGAFFGSKIKKNIENKSIFKIKKIFVDSNSTNRMAALMHYIIGFTISFSMFGMVFSVGEILMEKKDKTWQRQLVSPLSARQIMVGNLMPICLIGFIQTALLVVTGKYLFNIDWGNAIPTILIILAAFSICTTSMGLCLSGILKSYEQLGSITPVIIVSTSMLGGCMWPLEIINSKVLLAIANITPQYWAVQSIERMTIYGVDSSKALVPILVLIGMSTVYLTIGTLLVNRKTA